MVPYNITHSSLPIMDEVSVAENPTPVKGTIQTETFRQRLTFGGEAV